MMMIVLTTELVDQINVLTHAEKILVAKMHFVTHDLIDLCAVVPVDGLESHTQSVINVGFME